MTTSCRNDRTRLTFAPDSSERMVAMRPSPSAESHSGSSSDGSSQTQFLDRCLTQRTDDRHRVDRDLDRRGEELFLGPEVVVHQCRVHARVGSDAPDRGVADPVAREHFSCTVQNPLPGVGDSGGTSRPPPSSVVGHGATGSAVAGWLRPGTAPPRRTRRRPPCRAPRSTSMRDACPLPAAPRARSSPAARC